MVMEKPLEPTTDDCCNSGCNPCIFDIYEKQLKLYNKYLESGEKYDNLNSQVNGIAQLKYTNFIVVENMALCNMHRLITFKRETPNGNVWWKPGDHFLFKYSGTKTTCTRAYTPVKTHYKQSEGYDFSIVVKKYDNGLVSTYLCSLNTGDLTSWRGPYGHYNLEPNMYDKIIMIAQGTGIATFITIIDNILKNEDDNTKILLLYCCKCDNIILFREELYAFRSYWNFKYEVFVSSISDNFKSKYQEPIKKHKFNIEYLSNLNPVLGKQQFLLCGSPEFNTTYNNYLRSMIPEIQNNYIVVF